MDIRELAQIACGLADKAYPPLGGSGSGGRDAYNALLRFLIERSREELEQLSALYWLGTGDFDGYDEALAHARQEYDRHTADYLAGKQVLAEYLRAGLAKQGWLE